MKSYEHTFILRSDSLESQNTKLFDKFKNIITKNSGKILKTENWGLRTLSHEIKKNKKGFYFHLKFDGIGTTIAELENAENLDDKVLRFLTVKVKKHDLETNYFPKKEFNQTLTDKKDEKK